MVVSVMTYPKTPITNKFLIGVFSAERFDWCTSFFMLVIVRRSSIRKIINQMAHSPMKIWETLIPKIKIVGIYGKMAHATNRSSIMRSPLKIDLKVP